MPESVHRIFGVEVCLLIFDDQTRRLHDWSQRPEHVAVALNPAALSGENESLSTLGELPLPESLHHVRRQRDRAAARCGLWIAENFVTVGALRDLQFSVIKLDVRPLQPAKF